MSDRASVQGLPLGSGQYDGAARESFRRSGVPQRTAKAADLAAQGIEIPQGDYFDYDSLLRAFTGVEKVMLIATHGFTDRNTQHYNVITAARQASVKHIAYTAIIRKEGSGFILPEATVAVATAQHKNGTNQVKRYVLAQGLLQWPNLNTTAEKAMSLLDTFPIGDPEVLMAFLEAQYPCASFVPDNTLVPPRPGDAEISLD